MPSLDSGPFASVIGEVGDEKKRKERIIPTFEVDLGPKPVEPLTVEQIAAAMKKLEEQNAPLKCEKCGARFYALPAPRFFSVGIPKFCEDCDPK